MARTEQLGEAIAELAARLHAATYELLVLLRQFDADAGWNNGFLSCAHWLHWRTGIDLGAAREKVRVAKALAALPRLSAALQCGKLSYAKVRAVTRIATPENESQLIDVALAGTTAHVERLVRGWRRVDRIAAAKETEQRHLQRSVSTYVDEDGMVVIRGRLTPEVGAVVQRALEAAADRLFRESAGTRAATTVAEEVTFAQRRADALVLLAESALAADFDRGTAGDRYQVVLHVEGGALQSEDVASGIEDAGPSAQAVLEMDGRPVDVSYETSQRLVCDAATVVMRHGSDGSVLDVGRRTRTVPPAIRRALEARDERCQFPGCTARRCDAHHIIHWADGGATQLDNLMLLCRRHHRAVHEGGFDVMRGRDGTLRFARPDGEPIDLVPAMPEWDHRDRDPLSPTTSRLAAAGTFIRASTMPRWDGTPFNVVWAIDVLRGHERDPIASGPPRVQLEPGRNVCAETHGAESDHN
jgi:hypothetical protein